MGREKETASGEPAQLANTSPGVRLAYHPSTHKTDNEKKREQAGPQSLRITLIKSVCSHHHLSSCGESSPTENFTPTPSCPLPGSRGSRPTPAVGGSGQSTAKGVLIGARGGHMAGSFPMESPLCISSILPARCSSQAAHWKFSSPFTGGTVLPLCPQHICHPLDLEGTHTWFTLWDMWIRAPLPWEALH